MLDCPNFLFNTNYLGRYNPTWGFLIGYQYLGDAVIPSNCQQYPWFSPTRLSQSATNNIIADANHWGEDGLIAAPHRRGGSIKDKGSSFVRGAPGVSPAALGAEGGNVGKLDGSVSWKKIKQMPRNQASSYVFYWGNW